MISTIELRVLEAGRAELVQPTKVQLTNGKHSQQWKVRPGTRLEVLLDGVVQTGKAQGNSNAEPFKLKRLGANLLVVDQQDEAVLELTDFFATSDVTLLGEDWSFVTLNPADTSQISTTYTINRTPSGILSDPTQGPDGVAIASSPLVAAAGFGGGIGPLLGGGAVLAAAGGGGGGGSGGSS